jgi:hypothetical protein
MMSAHGRELITWKKMSSLLMEMLEHSKNKDDSIGINHYIFYTNQVKKNHFNT